MKYMIVCFLFLTTIAAQGASLITVESQHDFAETVKLLKSEMKKKNFSIFSEIDHQKGAKKIGLSLNKNKLIIFGNPKGGTPLMQENSLMGFELPLKILITENEKNVVEVSYRDSRTYLAEYNLEKNKKRLKKIYQAINKLAGVVKK